MAADANDGAARIANALETGAAAEVFGRMIAAQGGPTDFVERWPDRLPSAPVLVDVPCLKSGFITAIDGQALGLAVIGLGGGRHHANDKINPSVGLSDMAALGEECDPDVSLCQIHAASLADAEAAILAVQAAFEISDAPPVDPELIYKRITK